MVTLPMSLDSLEHRKVAASVADLPFVEAPSARPEVL
jgi:hypothetical protein